MQGERPAAVLLDWRGTLVWSPPGDVWVRDALRHAGRDAGAASVEAVLRALDAANGPDNRLDTPGMDCDSDLHRSISMAVFQDAGLDPDLADSLYGLQSDPLRDPFASDVPETLGALQDRGIRIAVVSDIHMDIRPAFVAADLAHRVDVFTLSFELGAQKPDPAVFLRTLDVLGVEPVQALMVGDRSLPDGGAVEVGIPTLLLPPLRSVHDRRLHRVLALCR